MLNQQRKTKTFMQSMKLKKAKELSRGFSNWRRDGKDKGKGRGKSAIDDLKAVTKCAICKKPGHWHRECPEKGSSKDRDRGKDLHYVQIDDDDKFSEAAFCGMLEQETGTSGGYGAATKEYVDPQVEKEKFQKSQRSTDHVEKDEPEITRPPGLLLPPGLPQRDRLCGGDGSGLRGGQEGLHPGHRHLSFCEPTEADFEGHEGLDETFGAYKDHFCDTRSVVSEPEPEIMWSERRDGNLEKPGSRDPHGRDTHHHAVNEDYCATIDTGCQRMAIGQDTLSRLIPHVPEPLKVVGIKQEHRFKSVHGRSVTDTVAAIPTGLGHSGSIPRPAVFSQDYSRGAPFLLSLPFLLHCCTSTHRDNSGSRRFKFSARWASLQKASLGESEVLLGIAAVR